MEGVRVLLETPVEIENFCWVEKNELETTYAFAITFEISRKVIVK
jgi:hypothetical protein